MARKWIRDFTSAVMHKGIVMVNDRESITCQKYEPKQGTKEKAKRLAKNGNH